MGLKSITRDGYARPNVHAPWARRIGGVSRLPVPFYAAQATRVRFIHKNMLVAAYIINSPFPQLMRINDHMAVSFIITPSNPQ